MGIVDRPIGRLPSHPHPPKLKEIPKVLLQATGVPVHLPSVRTSHSPPDLYNDCKGSEAQGPLKRTHQYVDDWLIRCQSQEEAQVKTRAVVDLTQSLGWIINQEKSELTPTQVFLFVGYEYHLDSALVKPTQERCLILQDLILRLKSKHVLTARCLMSLIGLLASMEKMVPEGRLHMRPFQFHLKEHWRYPQSLDNLLPWTDVISAHLDWWQNPANVMKGPDLHPKDHSIQLFTDASNEGWGTHLDQRSTQGLWSDQEKKATHKRLRVEGSLTGPLKLQGPVPGPNSSSCNGQLDSGSLHKQTRGNSLRYVRSPVEDHDLVPPLSHNIKGQTHSRVSECDGGPPIQVQPSAVDRMVTASTGVQTDLPEVVHSSCGPVSHSSKPQTPSLRVPNPRPKGLGHRCSEHKLDGSHCLWLPSDGPSQGDQKIKQCHCLIIVIAPGLPGMPWFWDLVQLSTEIPTRSSTRTIYKSKWALFEKWCRENSVDFSTPSVKQVSDFFMYLYQDLNRRPSTIDGYRTAIVDTLGPTAHHIAHNADLHRFLSSFHRDRPKSSRNLPKWNLSVVLNELTKAPFEPMRDTDLKHLTLKTAFLLALASSKRHKKTTSKRRFSKCVSGDYSCFDYHSRSTIQRR